MTTEIKWGVEPNEFEIASIFEGIIATDSHLKLIHLQSGLTDNVFRVVVDSETSRKVFILKEYLESWHYKEADIYSDILQNDTQLGAPNLIKRSGRFIILDYLDPLKNKKFEAEDIPLLVAWIKYKQESYLNKVPEKYDEPIQRKIKYLVTTPIGILKSMLSAEESPLDISTLDSIIELETPLIQSMMRIESIPKTLEHGDLEPQNLFVDVDGDAPQLRVLDWVNARADSGLFDIAQLLENIDFMGSYIRVDSVLDVLCERFPFSMLRSEVKYAEVLMTLNKLEFYLSKYKNGERTISYNNESFNNLIKRCAERLLTRYYSET